MGSPSFSWPYQMIYNTILSTLYVRALQEFIQRHNRPQAFNVFMFFPALMLIYICSCINCVRQHKVYGFGGFLDGQIYCTYPYLHLLQISRFENLLIIILLYTFMESNSIRLLHSILNIIFFSILTKKEGHQLIASNVILISPKKYRSQQHCDEPFGLVLQQYGERGKPQDVHVSLYIFPQQNSTLQHVISSNSQNDPKLKKIIEHISNKG